MAGLRIKSLTAREVSFRTPIAGDLPLLGRIPNINSYTKFEENRSKMLKIESGNEFLMSTKGHNSGLN